MFKDNKTVTEEIREEFNDFFANEGAPEELKEVMYKAFLTGYIKATLMTLKDLVVEVENA